MLVFYTANQCFVLDISSGLLRPTLRTPYLLCILLDAKLATLLAERSKDKERIETLKQHLTEERERVEMVQKIDTRAKGGDPENLRQALQGKLIHLYK